MNKSTAFVTILLGTLIAYMVCASELEPNKKEEESETAIEKSSGKTIDDNQANQLVQQQQDEAKKPASNTEFASNTDNTGDNNAPWILPGFDKEEVISLGKNESKCWKTTNYRVCINRFPHKTRLEWKNIKSKTLVEMDIFKNGDIMQKWKYHNSYAHFRYIDYVTFRDGIWRFGKSSLKEYKYADGTTKKIWKGDENLQAWRDYQQFIESWCKSNDFFVSKEKCTLYKNLIEDTLQ